MALPRRARLDRSSFALVSARGRVLHSPEFSLRIFKKTEEISRFSAVISSKAASRAVVRNRIRRRVYRILENIPQGWWGVVYVKKKGAELPPDVFSSTLEAFLKRAGL